jgi:hypothetical protein
MTGVWDVRVQVFIPGRILIVVLSGCVAHPSSCSMATGVVSTEIRRPEREIEPYPLSSAEVKNEWSYTCTPVYAVMAWTGTTLPLLLLPHKSPQMLLGECVIRPIKNVRISLVKYTLR